MRLQYTTLKFKKQLPLKKRVAIFFRAFIFIMMFLSFKNSTTVL